MKTYKEFLAEGRTRLSKDQVAYIKKAVIDGLKKAGTTLEKQAAIYEKGEFPRADKVKDLQTRFMFDMLAAGRLSAWLSDQDVDNAHIKTALKSFMPKVTRKY